LGLAAVSHSRFHAGVSVPLVFLFSDKFPCSVDSPPRVFYHAFVFATH
jgi:hypothetical protein